ncbi:hypothetical protein HNQ07_003061 [Deinococcus metalli]|uniref:Uncharacterized protein n=1 Tax=Deinococcus metalli TaxID=1141878 RepID=A0A7W8NP35_9DEIO|nr:hypothetical protein [Deinococcus metalli]MBB5377569.1 hypothetical protein [Deinococcus metalli]
MNVPRSPLTVMAPAPRLTLQSAAGRSQATRPRQATACSHLSWAG